MLFCLFFFHFHLLTVIYFCQCNGDKESEFICHLSQESACLSLWFADRAESCWKLRFGSYPCIMTWPNAFMCAVVQAFTTRRSSLPPESSCISCVSPRKPAPKVIVSICIDGDQRTMERRDWGRTQSLVLPGPKETCGRKKILLSCTSDHASNWRCLGAFL